MNARTVLCVNVAQEQVDLRKAISKCIGNILTEHNCTLIDIAETIGVTVVTISSAFNRNSVLSTAFLKRLGDAYGGHALNPYLELIGGSFTPIDGRPKKDILPLVAKVNLRIVEARDPQSPCGARETHTERLGYLPDLEQLERELSCLICEIRKEAA
jgi:transcriptional regulator with XRE-family HTH domain